MNKQFHDVPTSFTSPEQLPIGPIEGQEWQHANSAFWESHPMRYDWSQSLSFPEFSKPFFDEIDGRFFSSTRTYLPWERIPFDSLINYQDLRSKHVLEIGVGMGSHAQLLAQHSASYTGIDLTRYAVQATSRRLRGAGLHGSVCQMDAEKLSFPDATFDFIWTWGVIHHTSNTQSIIREMHRVLKPSGKAVVMVYHRGWWNYYVLGSLVYGVILGGLFKTGSLAKSVQRHTDGALARYYTPSGWNSVVRDCFEVEDTVINGPKTDLFPIPRGRFKRFVMDAVPDKLTRCLTNRCRMGGFLISRLVNKPS